jgi:hypothetical protein
MKRVSGSLTLYRGRRRVVARHSRSLGGHSVMVGVIAIIGYALLCGVLYLK